MVWRDTCHETLPLGETRVGSIGTRLHFNENKGKDFSVLDDTVGPAFRAFANWRQY